MNECCKKRTRRGDAEEEAAARATHTHTHTVTTPTQQTRQKLRAQCQKKIAKTGTMQSTAIHSIQYIHAKKGTMCGSTGTGLQYEFSILCIMYLCAVGISARSFGARSLLQCCSSVPCGSLAVCLHGQIDLHNTNVGGGGFRQRENRKERTQLAA